MPVDGEALRAALVETAADHGPGLYALVTEGGQPVFTGTVGVADLDRPRPIAASDRCRIGSVTKMYVATLVLQLVVEGLLSLDDTVDGLLPDLVPGGADITVETLLRLRSGLPDYTPELFGSPPTDLSALERYWSPRQLVAASLATSDRIPPNSQYRYSSTDYILLGMMIEEATGERVDAQIWQHIIKPLNLLDTTFPTVDPYMRGPHAKGYLRTSADASYAELTTMTPSESWTAGAMVATASDVAAFLDGLFNGSLLPEGYLARMIEPTQRLDVHRSRGLGVVRLDFGTGNVAYGHQGGMPGYTTVAARTESGRCVVLWQNGMDLHNPLSSGTPFFQAALRG
ncbi:serine hydrolase domain-containing protein [Actinospica sp.]|jgi:D-alanyl-D-alanine carboxypeptidase|uniref:serine hydrolase domain-containing protein n=1 Tax=Actinospica sp. TaxID=1872142 RepID=UPI002B76828D|nr:serine hydrolase domain-containing protein [Actinospica sp.]HWG28057.1 serine hydrolase domain-containing protein [Actinospica sp.]